MRDTDRDWQTIALNVPYYGVLVHDKFLNPTAEALAEFFTTGANDIETC